LSFSLFSFFSAKLENKKAEKSCRSEGIDSCEKGRWGKVGERVNLL
jgi:hypothetical protein